MWLDQVSNPGPLVLESDAPPTALRGLAVLILVEVIRVYRELRKPLYVTFLDVNSAFDVVSHDSLLRKIFHIGVNGVGWTLIHSLH